MIIYIPGFLSGWYFKASYKKKTNIQLVDETTSICELTLRYVFLISSCVAVLGRPRDA